MKAYENFINEMNKIELLYAGSVNSYWQNKLRNSERIELGFISDSDPVFYNQGENFNVIISSNKIEFDKRMSSDLPQYLRETIFIRLISVLEIFFVDIIKELFVSRKDLFKTEERIEFSQGQLLSFNSISSLHTNLINNECRKIQNQGISRVSDYFKKRFNIDFKLCQIDLKEIVEMHDRRNILVHRMGRADESYKRKYKFEDSRITIEKKYIISSFSNIHKLTNFIYVECEKILNTQRDINSKDPRFTVEIIFKTLISGYVPVLDKDYSYLCGEEIIYLRDIIYRHHYDNIGRIHSIKASGSPFQMKSLINEFESSENNHQIEIIKCNTKEGIKRLKYRDYRFSYSMLRKIDDMLPSGKLPIDIHKSIAKKCGIREIQAKQAIGQILQSRANSPIDPLS